METVTRLLYTPEEAARVLRIGRSTLYEMLRDGSIESVSFGRARRVPVEALHRWIASRVRGGETDDTRAVG